VLLPPLPTNIGAGARAIARAPGGSIYVAGSGRFGRGSANILLTRLRPDGTLDTAFGQGGAVSTPVPRPAGSRETDVTGVAVQSDEKVVVSGYVITENDNRAFLARFNPDGSLDAGFGTGGIVADALPASQGGQIYDVAIAGDGAIVAAGARNAGSDRFDPAGDRFVVARYTPGGAPDPAFGSGGVATVEPGRGGRAKSIRVTGDKVVVGGQIDEGFALARLNADGSLDGSYGDARLTRATPPGSAAITQLTVLGDGRIVAAGTVANILGDSQLVLARYDAAGRIDGSFGDGGFAVDRHVAAPGGLIDAGDGRLLVSASAFFADHNSGAGLVRYTADGSRDPSFGQSGTLVGFASYGIAPGAILGQADGTVLAAQTYDSNFAVTRYVAGDPALAAAAGGPRACKASVETKSLGQLLRRGKSAKYGKLRVVFRRLQPGAVRAGATVRVGSRTATLATVTDSAPIAGVDVTEVKVSRSAYALLRKAKQAEIAVTVTGADGGASATATKTLKR
jgi:uncharacterized delta-60 repeat protein